MPTHDKAGNAGAHSTPNEEKLTLMVAGLAHSDWQNFEVESDLLTPADGWLVMLGFPSGNIPKGIVEGAPALLKVGSDTIMTGRIDTLRHSVATNKHQLIMSGRDINAVLVDCSAPIFSVKNMTLNEVIKKIVSPLGVSRIKINANAPITAKKVSIEPGQTAWEALSMAAEINGLWPWTDPDGTLIIGGPDYTAKPVGSLVMRYSGKGNNIINIDLTKSIARRFSQTTVLAQKHGTEEEDGVVNLKSTVRDIQIALYRPKIMQVHDVQNQQEVEFRAKKLQADARLNGFTLTIGVKGFRAPNGQLWTPGQRVHVVSEPHAIDDIFFLMKRRVTGGRPGIGAMTTLTLKQDATWLPEVYPKQKHHKKKDDGGWIVVDKNTPVY